MWANRILAKLTQLPRSTIKVLLATGAIALSALVVSRRKGHVPPSEAEHTEFHSLQHLQALTISASKPIMLVDMDNFDHNVHLFANIAARAGKTIRIGTKSVRVPYLLRKLRRPLHSSLLVPLLSAGRCLQLREDVFKGLMCFR